MNGLAPLAWLFGAAAPVEVVAAGGLGGGLLQRALGDRREREPRRRHQRLLRAGDDDVDAPVVLVQPRGAEARDGVDGEQRAVAAHDLGDRLHVVDDPGRGLAERAEDDLDARVLLQRAVDLGGVDPHAPARLVADELGAVGLAELDPALAELAGRQRQRLGARAHEVGDGRLHRARAARAEREHRVGGPEHRGQAAEHALVELVERRRAVVEHRRRHRLRDLRRDRGRAGRHEVLLDVRIRGHRRRQA